MANPLFPAAPAIGEHIAAVPAIMGPIPSHTEVVREHHRFYITEVCQEMDRTLSDQDYGAAIVRHHGVVNARSDSELRMNDASIGNQLTRILEQIGNLEKKFDRQIGNLEKKIDRLSAGQSRIGPRIFNLETNLDRVGANVTASGARFFNKLFVDNPSGKNTKYRLIVKTIAGHPWTSPPTELTCLFKTTPLVFSPYYQVGSEPPDGLLPRTPKELDRMRSFDHLMLRDYLRAAFWFYRDNRIFLEENANGFTTIECLDQLKEFLIFP